MISTRSVSFAKKKKNPAGTTNEWCKRKFSIILYPICAAKKRTPSIQLYKVTNSYYRY